MKISCESSFIFMQIKVISALKLVLKQSHKGTRKWPITSLRELLHFCFEANDEAVRGTFSSHQAVGLEFYTTGTKCPEENALEVRR